MSYLRHWCLTWGARADEVTRKLSGDELLPGTGLVTTRAITVGTPPESVWPWLVQMGSGRGGAYTYDPPRVFALRIAGMNWVWISRSGPNVKVPILCRLTCGECHRTARWEQCWQRVREPPFRAARRFSRERGCAAAECRWGPVRCGHAR